MPTETRTKITYDSASIHSSPTTVTVASRTGNTRPGGLNFGAPPGESPTQRQRRSESPERIFVWGPCLGNLLKAREHAGIVTPLDLACLFGKHLYRLTGSP